MDPKFLKPYNPAETEKVLYERWEKSGFFNPDNLPLRQDSGQAGERKEAFSMVLPPPNVTGILHMGSALMLVIEDILVRHARMAGKKTLWIPGTDSAAIATQAKVEKDIQKSEGKSRHDLGREELLKRIDAFVDENKNTIVEQMKRMGSSLDWSRLAYTMDDKRYRAVMEAFVQMYEAGLIYRGDRIVNWDPASQTTVSDDEIEYKEQKDAFYYFTYGPFTIGTVRPETKFGDKYVVIHPDDKRYKKYTHGEKIELEWINGPITATVIKDKAADMEMGSGVMTITPAHSLVDFEIAKRHGLDIERVIDDRGILLPIAGEFAGDHIKKARPKIVAKLEAKGLVEKIDKNYMHSVATNYRGGGVIEPQIKLQWFIDVNKEFALPHSEIQGIKSGSKTTLKKMMRAAVENSNVKILPERYEKIYFHWIDNLRDWCISRQIWFGHRIPVWYDKDGKAHLPKIKELVFVRHGESKGNEKKLFSGQVDEPLTEKGREQAKMAARGLDAKSIGAIISSDLSRGKETAEIIKKELRIDVPVNAYKEFREIDPGELTNTPFTSEMSIIELTTKSKKGETLSDIERRVQNAKAILRKTKSDKKILIVDHLGFSSCLQASLIGCPKEEYIRYRHEHRRENAEISQMSALFDPEGKDLVQDPDTLDTWFSSGLWTLSTLGWPDETEDLKTFHPTSVLETGYDIIFFWVARMILMSGFLTGQVPFRQVYLHGLVRDKSGQKISKSLGNNIDPLDMGAKYGTDAVRVSLIAGMAPGTDSRISEEKIRGYKHFANKIWNITRFVLENTEGFDANAKLNTKDAALAAEVDALGEEVSSNIEKFRIDLAFDALYHFIWHRFADEIIEESKPILKGEDAAASSRRRVLYETLVNSLKLLHPFMPFVTEEIWSALPKKDA
ncbi:class I tRNA ligase family protein, partial [Candidatus Kaiserbacteria bacterium]|nr:class I tRNA ligase family protein [Candidatus Kaiserbacteria bacterium]